MSIPPMPPAGRHGCAPRPSGLGDHDLGREQQARHRGGVLQRQARHLGRVQDTFLEQVTDLPVAAL